MQPTLSFICIRTFGWKSSQWINSLFHFYSKEAEEQNELFYVLIKNTILMLIVKYIDIIMAHLCVFFVFAHLSVLPPCFSRFFFWTISIILYCWFSLKTKKKDQKLERKLLFEWVTWERKENEKKTVQRIIMDGGTCSKHNNGRGKKNKRWLQILFRSIA